MSYVLVPKDPAGWTCGVSFVLFRRGAVHSTKQTKPEIGSKVRYRGLSRHWNASSLTPALIYQPPLIKRAPIEADALQALVTSDTFDESNTGLTIASGCPPEITFRLVTSLAECAHNTLDCCDRLLVCCIGIRDNPALDSSDSRGELHDLKGHCNNLRRATGQ